MDLKVAVLILFVFKRSFTPEVNSSRIRRTKELNKRYRIAKMIGHRKVYFKIKIT
jgi:hypothetical protein